ncbi:MAG: alanine--tRNA ligase, partial [Bacteroidales bacterium]|nr:alanine--tRNA ligase [Bacteroidales bacterium]
ANYHSCTHLMHRALREILGSHVEQKRSYVSDKGFRFDFSHFEKLSDEQVAAVEKRVNELIRSNFPLYEERTATMARAQELGAMALFGEKYGDRVRVVRFGPSVELCGGCHTSATGNIGLFKIVGESAIAAGIRRIEAVTGEDAELMVNGMQQLIKTARAFFNNVPDLAGAIQKLIDDNATFKKQAEEFSKAKAVELARWLQDKAQEVNGVRIIVAHPSGGHDFDPAMLRNAALNILKELKGTAVVAAFESDGKPQLLLAYSDDLVAAGHNAGKEIRDAARFIQGGGGGQPGLASAGGKNIAGLKEAQEALIAIATGQ